MKVKTLQIAEDEFLQKKSSLSIKGFVILLMVIGHGLGHLDYWLFFASNRTITMLEPFFHIGARLSVPFSGLFPASCGRLFKADTHKD